MSIWPVARRLARDGVSGVGLGRRVHDVAQALAPRSSACWNCCHRPARRSIGCDMRAGEHLERDQHADGEAVVAHHEQRADAQDRAASSAVRARWRRRCRCWRAGAWSKPAAGSSRDSSPKRRSSCGSICSDFTVSMPATYSVTKAWLRAPSRNCWLSCVAQHAA